MESEDATRALRASLVAVADGARSRVRDALGVSAKSRPYHQTAVIGTVEVSKPGDGKTAYERFTPQGPMALLPGPRGRCVFVFTRRESQVDAVLALDDSRFRALLQDSFGLRLGRFGAVGKRVAYPLSLTTAGQIVAQRAAIVGNAAHGLHPVAGQGYNLGLRDVATLAELVADQLAAQNADIGAPEVLDRYRAWRQRDHRNVVAFTDGLIRLFDLPASSVGTLRGLGLAAFDIAPGAKRTLARQTMGLGGRLTRLVRGLQL